MCASGFLSLRDCSAISWCWTLRAGTGLLTWEAVRQVPEGGVWALAMDAQNGAALRQQAGRLPEVERPVVLIGAPAELDYLLDLRGEAELHFDCIMGRNIFIEPRQELEALLGAVAPRIRPGGLLCLAQSVPRHTQRLYALVDWDGAADLLEKVKAAEEGIYHDADDPLVNWDETAVRHALEAAGLLDVQVTIDRQMEQRRLWPEQVERWLAVPAGEGERPSYMQRLAAAGLSETELQEVARRYRRSLLNQEVGWQSSQAYIRARAGETTAA